MCVYFKVSVFFSHYIWLITILCIKFVSHIPLYKPHCTIVSCFLFCFVLFLLAFFVLFCLFSGVSVAKVILIFYLMDKFLFQDGCLKSSFPFLKSNSYHFFCINFLLKCGILFWVMFIKIIIIINVIIILEMFEYTFEYFCLVWLSSSLSTISVTCFQEYVYLSFQISLYLANIYQHLLSGVIVFSVFFFFF